MYICTMYIHNLAHNYNLGMCRGHDFKVGRLRNVNVRIACKIAYIEKTRVRTEFFSMKGYKKCYKNYSLDSYQS